MSPVSDHMMDKRRLMEMLNDTDATIFQFRLFDILRSPYLNRICVNLAYSDARKDLQWILDP